MTRTVSIFGATGSIGTQTLKLLETLKPDISLKTLTAQRNVEKLAALAVKWQPEAVVLADERGYGDLKSRLSGQSIKILAGQEGLLEMARQPVDWTMMAIASAQALPVTLALLGKTKVLALANKESIVCGGNWFLQKVRESGTNLIPVDSEHNALYQLYNPVQQKSVREVMITASGGPFRHTPLEELAHVTPEMAARHPVWPMGQKISIDSATLMNKGLEVIEAAYLFGLKPEQVKVWVHPQALIHGMVMYTDGSTLAHLSYPDMLTPIGHAWAFPDRVKIPHQKIDVTSMNSMDFFEVDTERFPAVCLARDALAHSAAGPVVFNAANEVAVQAFIEGRIPFTGIPGVVEKSLSALPAGDITSFNHILEADQAARTYAASVCGPVTTAAESSCNGMAILRDH